MSESLLQFIKYGIAGGVATFAHICVFHLLAWKIFPSLQKNDFAVRMFGLAPPQVDDATRSRNSMISNIVTFIFSNLIAYLLNIYWVFEQGRHHVVVEILLFYLVSGISVLLGTSLMGFLIKRFGILTTHAFAANIASAVLINFVVRKYFVFSG